MYNLLPTVVELHLKLKLCCFNQDKTTLISLCSNARTPKSSHITPVLKSLHWLKINERIKYKLLSPTYKVLTTHQPQYLHDSISVQLCHNTRSSSMVYACPPTRSSLKIINRSFRYAAPCLWNELPTDLRKPRQTQSPALSPITHGSLSSSPSSLSPLASSLTRSEFHSELKT